MPIPTHRGGKEIKLSLEQKTQQLSEKNKENESLKSAIDDLTKILSIAEQENKINTVQPPKPKKSFHMFRFW